MVNFLSSNVVGTIAASIVAAGLIFGAGHIANNAIDRSIVSDSAILTTASPTFSPIIPTDDTSLNLPPTGQVEGIITNRANISSDPIVACQFPHSGPIDMPESKCQQMTDCEVEPGKWQAVYQKDCETLHKSQENDTKHQASPTTAPTTNNEKLIDCIFDDSWGKSHEYKQVTEASCAESKRIWTSNSTSSSAHLPTPAPFKANCYVGNQVIPNLTTEECTKRMQQYSSDQQAIADLQRQHDDACNRAYADWRTTKEQFYANDANSYSSSAEAMKALYAMMQKYQAEMRLAGCTQTLSL